MKLLAWPPQSGEPASMQTKMLIPASFSNGIGASDLVGLASNQPSP